MDIIKQENATGSSLVRDDQMVIINMNCVIK